MKRQAKDFHWLAGAAIIAALAFSGCSNNSNLDSDGVPIVEDIRNIVVNGKKMTTSEFREQYCNIYRHNHARTNATCNRAVMQSRMESRQSTGDRSW